VSTVVLDASAGAGIVMRSALGRRLLSLAPRDRQWWVPDHFDVEAAGAVRRMLLRGVIDETRATSAIERLLTLRVVVSRSQPLISEAWTLRRNIIIHDAIYVALARHIGAPLLTGDRRLAGAPNLPIQILHLSASNP
jgi:predicted nucleic acid-binding protein